MLSSLSLTSSMDFDAEVSDVQKVVLRELDELADGVDTGALQAVVGADGKVQVLDLLVKLGVGFLDPVLAQRLRAILGPLFLLGQCRSG